MTWINWEDWSAGLYGPATEQADECAGLLCDPAQFYEAATEMLREWPIAAVQNLVHMWSGRRAWLGQATCCYVLGAPGATTRQAWGTLTDFQQLAANRVADSVIDRWEKGRADAQTVLALDCG